MCQKVTSHTETIHGFSRYCFCDAIYNSATEQSTFFQCIACEDWFHDRCVGEMPDEEAFEDFVCRRCVDRFPFVLRYVGIEEGAKKEEAISNDGAAVRSESIAADSTSSVKAAITDKKEDDSPMPIIAVTAGRSLRSDDTAIVVHRNDLLISTRKTPEIEGTEGDNTCDTPVDEQPTRKKLRPANECLLAQLPPSFLDTTLYQYDLFVTVPIQSVLCKCNDCVSMYTREQCSFFIDEEPTVEPEPDQGANVSSYEAGMQAFDTLDHTTKMNGLASYDRMRESIRGFLLPFAQSQRVVTKEDVQKFFGDKLGSRP